MVNFEKDGQGYEFIEENCSGDFIKSVKSSLERDSFETNEIIKVIKNGNTTEVFISHEKRWFSILTEIKAGENDFMYYNDFISLDHMNVISDFLAGDKND